MERADPMKVTLPNLTHPPGPRHAKIPLPNVIAEMARASPTALAILSPDRESLTYEGLAHQMDMTARALARAGYECGSRIAIALPGGPELATAVVAVCACATCAPLNPDLDESALSRLLRTMRIDALIAAHGEDSFAVRGARRVGVPVLGLRFSGREAAGTFELVAPRATPAGSMRPPALDDVALLMHTSGTTSAPKIVPLTHRHLAEAAWTRIELLGIDRRDRCLLATPLYAAAGIRRSLLPPLLVGGSIVCPRGFEAAGFLDLLERFAPTYYATSAAAQIAILDELERRARPVKHALRFAASGGAVLSPSVQRRLARALGVPIIQGYGMTETGTITQTTFPPIQTPEGSAGLPANVEVAIMDDGGRMLGPGTIGEVVVRGPEVFGGYENDPEANRAAFRDGWFRSGDAGRFDEAGFLFLAGRLTDVINRGGAKVSPSEVEEALARHPLVVEAAAFALPHPTLGEDVAAAVVLRADGAVTEDGLRDFARNHLAAFKVPTRIVTVGDLPRGAFGKVRRGELAAFTEPLLRTKTVPPRDEEEAKVAAIFAEVLDLDRIGVLDNFFQFGGDSLRAARVIARLQSEFQASLTVKTLFDCPTVAAIMAEIRAGNGRATAAGVPAITALPRRAYIVADPSGVRQRGKTE